jgi:hypothetical protein
MPLMLTLGVTTELSAPRVLSAVICALVGISRVRQHKVMLLATVKVIEGSDRSLLFIFHHQSQDLIPKKDCNSKKNKDPVLATSSSPPN